MIMKNIKSLIIGVFVMAIMLSPLAMSAQGLFGTDGFFKVEDNNYYNNRDAYTINSNQDPGISNQTFGQPLPLGSGIAVLLAAGAGYAIMKKRKNND